MCLLHLISSCGHLTAEKTLVQGGGITHRKCGLTDLAPGLPSPGARPEQPQLRVFSFSFSLTATPVIQSPCSSLQGSFAGSDSPLPCCFQLHSLSPNTPLPSMLSLADCRRWDLCKSPFLPLPLPLHLPGMPFFSLHMQRGSLSWILEQEKKKKTAKWKNS